MKLLLPPGLTPRAFDKALAAFERAVGKEWVLATDEDRETYLDAYAPGNEGRHAPSAAVAPASVEEIQAVLRIANEHKVPLWPISRGKNFGYGGAAPRLAGSVILDLGRMKRILEINEKLGYCVLEPGVGFYDLYAHLEEHRIPLQMGIPGNGWGSVMGNALERGFSAQGDHSNNICGLEVVLPHGEILRTGMGAMKDNPAWPVFKHGFGPSWDQAFVQGNFGVVTRMGFWLQPLPEASISVGVKLDQPEDLGWFIDAITPLRLRGVLDGNVSVTSYQSSATTQTQRSEWYQGRDAIPDSVVEQIKTKYGVGWWNGTLRLSGYPEVIEANLKLVLAQLARYTRQEFPVTRSRPGQRIGTGPSVAALQIVNWYGGRGGHIAFSPVMPSDGRLVVEQFRRTRARYMEFGVDYSATFYNYGRHATNVNIILYNKDDADLTTRVQKLFDALVKDSAAHGYAEYRTHLSYMDAVADSFSFNDHALRRFNESIKDTLDPNGILAPGRNGIWPRAYRDRRGKA